LTTKKLSVRIFIVPGPGKMHPGMPERRCMTGALPSCPLKWGETGKQLPLHTSIIGNFRDAGERWNGGGISLSFL